MFPRELSEVIRPPSSNAFLGFFYGMMLAGGIGMLTIVVTVIRAGLYRCGTWFAFCVSWMITCISFLLLLGQPPKAELPFGLCLTQAVLVYATPVLVAYSTLALAIQLTTLFAAKTPKSRCDLPYRYWIPLLVFPYVAFLGVAIVALIIGMRDHTQVGRVEVSCYIANRTPNRIASSLIALAMVVVLGLVVYNGVRAYRLWHVMRQMDESAKLSLMVLSRMAVFILFDAAAVVVSIASVTQTSHLAPDVFIALMPFFTFFVFGTQKDIMNAWMFWRKPYPRNPVQSTVHDSSFDIEGERLSRTSSSLPPKSLNLDMA